MTTATAVTERPILFTGAMVRALLEGRKTQTRRVVKPQPNDSDVPDRINCEMYCPIVIRRGLEEPGPEQYGFWSDDADWKCPYGQPGDRLWVRETWAYEGPDGLSGLGYQYKADGAWLPVAKWKPSIHMHRAASRITLEITGVRVERVKDISEADAVAEGFSAGYGPKSTAGVSALWSARDRFLDLFYNLRKRASPNENPWVWVLEFKRVPQDGEAARGK